MKKFNLLKYILPATLSAVMIGSYSNVDGLFIGNALGDDGLAAVNIAWPIVAFITSVGAGLGIGGSIAVNGTRGKGDTEVAERKKFTALLLLFVAGILTTALCSALYIPVLKFLGATGEVFRYAENYSLVISLGAAFQVVGIGLIMLLRGEGKTVSALIYSAVGLIAHVVFDALTVKKFGLYGVSGACVAAQAIVAALSLVTFLKKDKNRETADTIETLSETSSAKPRFSDRFPDVKEILKNSIAPFGVNFAPSAALLFTNFFALASGGTAAVSAYAVMSYVSYTFDYVYQGVCDGIQPVLSYYEGARDEAGKKRSLRTVVIILSACSVAFIALTPLAIAFMPKVFATSAEAEAMMRTGFWIYAISYPFKAAARFGCSYFYSVGGVKIANALTYTESLLVTPLALLSLSFAGINGVWTALPSAQIVMCLILVVILIVRRHSAKRKSPTIGDNT